MTTPKDKSIYQIAWTMLNDEFQPGGDDYKGVSKEIHNAALEAGWRLLDAEQLALLFGPAPTELDRLRRWKSEAEAVIEEWDTLWEMAGCPGELGKTKAAGLLAALQSDGII